MPLLGGELGDVRRVLDDLPAIVGPHVVREDATAIRAVGDAHLGFGGDEGERFLDEVMRDRIVVEVEADVGRLAGADGAHHVALEAVLGERQEARALLVEGDVDEAPVGIAGDRALVRGRLDPIAELAIEIFDGREAPRLEEGVAEVLDGALHFPLFVAARRRFSAW